MSVPNVVIPKAAQAAFNASSYDFSLDCECLYLELTCSRFREAAHKLYENAGFIKRDSDIYRKDVI